MSDDRHTHYTYTLQRKTGELDLKVRVRYRDPDALSKIRLALDELEEAIDRARDKEEDDKDDEDKEDEEDEEKKEDRALLRGQWIVKDGSDISPCILLDGPDATTGLLADADGELFKLDPYYEHLRFLQEGKRVLFECNDRLYHVMLDAGRMGAVRLLSPDLESIVRGEWYDSSGSPFLPEYPPSPRPRTPVPYRGNIAMDPTSHSHGILVHVNEEEADARVFVARHSPTLPHLRVISWGETVRFKSERVIYDVKGIVVRGATLVHVQERKET